MKTCKNCSVPLHMGQYSYCSNKCQNDKKYTNYISEWKNGEQSGNIGINTGNISGHLKRYLREKFAERCSLCDWNEKNPKTGKVPLEIDHIDGISTNNKEDNLRLLCPNCHSLTPNYKNLNRGKGRTWRTEKYIRNQT